MYRRPGDCEEGSPCEFVVQGSGTANRPLNFPPPQVSSPNDRQTREKDADERRGAEKSFGTVINVNYTFTRES